VRHFHVEKNAGDTYLEYLSLHEKFPNVQVCNWFRRSQRHRYSSICLSTSKI
jgi:GTP-dependent phosphoenolpyruvate carboxykinase